MYKQNVLVRYFAMQMDLKNPENNYECNTFIQCYPWTRILQNSLPVSYQ